MVTGIDFSRALMLACLFCLCRFSVAFFFFLLFKTYRREASKFSRAKCGCGDGIRATNEKNLRRRISKRIIEKDFKGFAIFCEQIALRFLLQLCNQLYARLLTIAEKFCSHTRCLLSRRKYRITFLDYFCTKESAPFQYYQELRSHPLYMYLYTYPHPSLFPRTYTISKRNKFPFYTVTYRLFKRKLKAENGIVIVVGHEGNLSVFSRKNPSLLLRHLLYLCLVPFYSTNSLDNCI